MAYVPIWYHRPQSSDCLALKQQWIEQKYIKKDFEQPLKLDDTYAGQFKCSLFVRNRSGAFDLQTFIIDGVNNRLRYGCDEVNMNESIFSQISF